MFFISLLKFSLSSSTLPWIHWAYLSPLFWTLHLLDYLTPFFLDLCSALSYGFCFFVFPYWLPFCVCFYILSKTPKTSGLISIALCSRYPEAQSWEGFSCRPNLAPVCAPLGAPVKIQQAIHRCYAYSYIKGPCQKPRSAATNVSLGTTQQKAQDSPRTHLDMACVEPWVGEGRVSRNLLGGATSVIQLEDVSAMAALYPLTGRRGKLHGGTMDPFGTSAWEIALLRQLNVPL